MSKNIVGFMLIAAPYSALNNAGSDAGERTENKIFVKSIRKGKKEVYPYVSGQALRYWWRNTLENHFQWNTSPIEREEKIAYTEANPFEYDDDDVFGYMRAPKGKKGETVTRLSPLKNSPLISVIPQYPTSDYATMSRQEFGDPVPYENELYSTVMHGIFSLDLETVGRFQMIYKTGYRNLTDNHLKKEKIIDSLNKSGANKVDDFWIMPKEIRIKRTTDVIKALPFISGGARQTLRLTDVTPKFLVLAILNSGNHIFMNLAKNDNGKPSFSIAALEQVLTDYAEYMATDIYIARRVGFMDELEEGLSALNGQKFGTKKVIYNTEGSFNKTVEAFTQEIAISIPE